MIYRLPSIVRRMIALGLVLLLGACVFVIGVVPIARAWSDNAQAIQEGRVDLGRFRASIRRTEASVPHAALPSQTLLVGETLALASATLQAQLQALFGSHGALRSIGALTTKTDAPLWIGVRADLQIAPDQLPAMLRRIEQHRQPLLVIHALHVRSALPAPRAKRNEPAPLQVQIEIMAPYGGKA